MSWGDVLLATSCGTVALAVPAGIWLALITWGTDPGRPKWQPALLGLALIFYFMALVTVLTKLIKDGVIR